MSLAFRNQVVKILPGSEISRMHQNTWTFLRQVLDIMTLAQIETLLRHILS